MSETPRPPSDTQDPIVLRDTPDAKWRLLELLLRAHYGEAGFPEVIFQGDSFDQEFLSAAPIDNAHILDSHLHCSRVGRSGCRPQRMERSPTERCPACRKHGARPPVFADSESKSVRKFLQNGSVHWSGRARRDIVYVRQFGRFSQDIAFWRERLSAPDSVRLSKGENRLQFRLHVRKDYERFLLSVQEFARVSWTGHAAYSTEDPSA